MDRVALDCAPGSQRLGNVASLSIAIICLLVTACTDSTSSKPREAEAAKRARLDAAPRQARLARLSGRVFFSDGSPVSRGVVWKCDADSPKEVGEGLSDWYLTDGRYEISFDGGAYRLIAMIYQTGSSPLRVAYSSDADGKGGTALGCSR
jgi:hypothetical protein